MKVKGTRTYQIAIFVGIAALLAGLSLFGLDISILEVFGEKAARVLESLVKMYVAFLALWKIARPHPMKHEHKS